VVRSPRPGLNREIVLSLGEGTRSVTYFVCRWEPNGDQGLSGPATLVESPVASTLGCARSTGRVWSFRGGWAVAERGEEGWAARRPVEVAREGLDAGLDRPVGGLHERQAGETGRMPRSCLMSSERMYDKDQTGRGMMSSCGRWSSLRWTGLR